MNEISAAAISGCGGMADASDSKSDVGDYVRVQVPPSALLIKKPPINLGDFLFLFS